MNKFKKIFTNAALLIAVIGFSGHVYAEQMNVTQVYALAFDSTSNLAFYQFDGASGSHLSCFVNDNANAAAKLALAMAVGQKVTVTCDKGPLFNKSLMNVIYH